MNVCLWDNVIRMKKKNNTEQHLDNKSLRMLNTYGFYFRDNCIWGFSKSSSKTKLWSNFIISPVIHIKDDKNDRNGKRIFNLKNEEGIEITLKFNQSELISISDFSTKLESAGNFIFFANTSELKLLKRYLYTGVKSAREIAKLGWQTIYNFYAWGNGIFDKDDVFHEIDDFGCVEIDHNKYYLPAFSKDAIFNTKSYRLQKRFFYESTGNVSLNYYTDLFFKVYGDNGKVAFCFLLATLFRDKIFDKLRFFPLLNIFGQKGSGKTQLGQSLASFFYTSSSEVNLNTATISSLGEIVGEVSNAIVHIDEYKNSIDIEKREFLKGLWGGVGRYKMNVDEKKIETTPVECGIIISGQEMATADIALFSRMIFLSFSKTIFTAQEKVLFMRLKEIEKTGLSHLTGELVKLRKYVELKFDECYKVSEKDIADTIDVSKVEDRTFKNWVVILAIYNVLESHLNIGLSYQTLLGIVSEKCVEQNRQTRDNNELSNFWDILDANVAAGLLQEDIDFKIRVSREKDMNTKEGCIRVKRDTLCLYINFQKIVQVVYQNSPQKLIPKETMKHYLEHCPEYLGTLKSMRFKVQNSNLSKVNSAMIFNYNLLKENYSINLELQPD